MWSELVPPDDGCERLDRYANNVVVGLLRRKGDPGRLGMRSEHPALGVLGSVTFAHEPCPYAPTRTELGDFLIKVIVHVPEKGESRREVIYIHPALDTPLDVSQAVGKGKGELLDGRRSGLTNVVAGDADGVPVGIVLRAVLDRIDDEVESG